MNSSTSDLFNKVLKAHNRLDLPIYVLLAIFSGLTISVGLRVLGGPLLLIAGVLASMIAIVVMSRPEIGLQILIFITYTRFSDVMITEFGAPSVAQPFIVFLFGVIFVRRVFFGERFSDIRATMVVLIFFLTSSLLGLLVARDIGALFFRVEDFLKDALISIMIVLLVRDAPTFRRAIWSLIAVALFLGTLNSFKYLTGAVENDFFGFARAAEQHIVGNEQGYRISGPIEGTNPFAHLMLPLVAITLERLLHARTPMLKLLAGWAFIASTMTVIFTFSRSSFIGMVLVFFLFAVRYIRRVQTVIIFGLVAFIILPFVPATYLQRVQTLGSFIPEVGGGSDGIFQEASLRGRLSENYVGILMYIDHPLIGVGWGNYNAWYLDYSSELGLDARRYGRSAHNFYLELAAEQGTVGLLVWFFLLGTMYYSMWKASRRLVHAGQHNDAHLVTGLTFGLVGYSLVALFVHDSYPRFFWLLFGIAMATSAVAQHVERLTSSTTVSQSGVERLPIANVSDVPKQP